MKCINKETIYKVLSIIILFVMFLICCRDANSQSFWVDELDWTVDYLADARNIIELFQLLIKGGFNLPLYYIAMFPIYNIAPFGEIWLLLPNFIAIIWGIYIINKVGNKIGKNLGFASLCIAATSFTLINNCAFEFRPYTFLFCFSTYALYRYICKLQEPKKRSNTILYALSIILLAYTHWFGCLIIAFYFLADVILWLKKKNTLSFILPYIALGIAFLPYFITMILNHTTNFSDYWVKPPTITMVSYTLFNFLMSNNFICMALFIIGFVILLSCFLKKIKTPYTSKGFAFVLIGGIIWTLVTIFIYSKFINPNTSLWMPRYFIVILPHIFIITSIPIAKLLCFSETMKIREAPLSSNEKNCRFSMKKILIIYVIILLICIIACINYQKVHEDSNSIFEPYREVSNLIASTPDLYEENYALLTSCGHGYLTYYFEKQGVKLPNSVFEAQVDTVLTKSQITKCVSDGKIVDAIDTTLEDLLKYDKLYLFNVHENFKKEVLDFIYENYDLNVIDKTLGFYSCVKREI